MSASKLYTTPRKASECNPNLWVLAPTTRDTEDAIKSLGKDAVGRTEFKCGRNTKHLKAYWARLAWLIQNNDKIAERWPSRDALDIAFKEAVFGAENETTYVPIDKNGNVFIKKIERKVTRSISFIAMKQTEFNEYFDTVFEMVDSMIGPINWKEVDFEQKRIS